MFPKKLGVSDKQIQKEDKAEIALKAIEDNKKVLDNKASALVFGSQYTLKQETNKTPYIDVSLRFLELATLSLEKPSVKDANLMMEISDGLLKGYKEEAELAKKKAAEAQGRAATSDKEKEEAKIAAKIASDNYEKAKKDHLEAEKKLALYTQDLVKLQENEKVLTEKADKAELALKQFARENSGKAAEYDSEHGFWQQFNIFSDIMSLIKKLFTIGIIGCILVVAFKVVEVFFPALSIVSSIFGLVIKTITKLFPAAKSFAGLVGDGVKDALTALVKANHDVLKQLKDAPIEKELLESYPDDKTFTKKETEELLLKLTDKTVDYIEKKLLEHTDSDTRGIISYVKADAGIKNETLVSHL